LGHHKYLVSLKAEPWPAMVANTLYYVYIPLWTYCGPGHTLVTSSSLPLSTLGHVCAVELEVDVPNGLYIRLHSVAHITAQSDVRLHYHLPYRVSNDQLLSFPAPLLSLCMVPTQ
jgi:hypothetical protein